MTQTWGQSSNSKAFMPYPAAKVANASTGPLSGMSFAAKDLFDVAGYPTSGGQPMLLALSGIKTRHAVTVQKLLDAGARFVGKTVTDELAFSMNGQNAHFGSPVNGAAPLRITGGSSSGSASAVSHGLCDFALGTDTGGSVRAPANHCGLFGLRPTHGRVSLEGALDLSPSLDTCGWFSRDIHTFGRVADVLLGNDDEESTGLDLLWPEDLWGLIDSPVRAALEPALQQVQQALGKARPVAKVVENFDELYWNFRYIQGREAWGVDGPLIESFQPPLGSGVRERFEWARKVTDEQVSTAWHYRKQLKQSLSALLGKQGVLLMPTMPDIAPLISQPESELEDYRNRAIRMLSLSGMTGVPQLTMPLAHRDSAPLGLSLLGPAGSDQRLIKLARKILGTAA
jgi:amidase